MPSNNARDIIFYHVLEHMKQDKDYFVVNADFVGRPLIAIKKMFPERFIQVGIAEQNMIAIASGLALSGKRVITFSPSPFVYLRAYDQLRNAIAEMNLPVTVVANGMGLTNPAYGSTHFTTEDYQMISLLPNVEMLTVVDEPMAKRVASYLTAKREGPTYVRVDFGCDGCLPEAGCDFEKGFRILRSGSGTLLIVQGYSAKTALKNSYPSEPTILEIFRRPFDWEALLREMKQYSRVIACEEQQLRGGLGSELLERIHESGAGIRLERKGIDYGAGFPCTFGSREYWMKQYAVDEEHLRKCVSAPQ